MTTGLSIIIVALGVIIVRYLYLYYKRYSHRQYYLRIGAQLKDVEFSGVPLTHLKIQRPSICRQIYSKSTVLPKNLGLGDLFGRWLGSCLGNLDVRDPAWSGLKKTFKPLFTMNKKEQLIEELISEWDAHLKSLYVQTTKDYLPVNLDDLIDDLPLKYILRLIFGKTFLQDKQREFRLLQTGAQHLMWSIFNNQHARSRFYRFLPTKTNQTLKQFQLVWQGVLESAKRHQAVQSEGLYHEVYQNFLKNRDRLKEERTLTDEMFSQTLAEIIYANQDVAIPSLAWLLTHYTKHHQLLDHPEHFIEESARLAPIFPTSMPKTTTSDLTVDGVTIKKGTTVCIDFVKIGQCEEWGMTDLDQFRPDRFAEVTMKNFISRFGYGGRHCPGQKLANQLFLTVLTVLRDRWVFLPVDPLKDQIETDPLRPFSMPQMKIWILRAQQSVSDPIALHFNCPPWAEEVEDGFVGISVNKRSPYLDFKNCRSLIKYLAMKRTSSEYVIMIADQIAHYNLQAFEKRKSQKAMSEALKLGDQFLALFNQAIQEEGADTTKIKLCRWSDLNVPDLTEDLAQFDNLSDRVSQIATRFLEHRGQNLVNKSADAKLTLIKKYIYSELPVLVCGICYQDHWYRLLYYSGSMTHLKKFAQDKGSLHHLVLEIVYQPEFTDVKTLIMRKMGVNQVKVPGFIGLDIEKLGS